VKALLLLSAREGGGRSFVAANLAPLLKAQLAELTPGESELGLYLGDSLPIHRLEPAALPSRLPAELHNGGGWLLVDGLALDDLHWEAWLEACGRALLVERGDLVGARRAARLVKKLEERHFPRQGLLLVWTPSSPAQPLPEFPGLRSLSLPEFPKAAERLASGTPASLADAGSPFGKAVQKLAALVEAMEAVQAGSPGVAEAAPAFEADAQGGGDPRELVLLKATLAGLRQELNRRHIEPGSLKAPLVRELAAALLAGEDAAWLGREAKARLEDELLRLVLGFGPLEPALADPEITEIMVNGCGQVFVEKKGKLSLSPISFWDDAQLMQVIERIVAPLGRRIDESSPKVDARLPDGSRVNAIIPPLALRGPCLTIRKFSKRRIRTEELVAWGALSPAAAEFLRVAVLLRKNIVVSGGTGSGKTTLLNALSSFIPEDERILTIEDSAELKLDQSHVVSLEARPKNMEGKGEVSIRDLVINALRMRPDRIVIGECRGGEALDMLQAMNTGHDGSLTTVHANNPRDALSRIETLCLMSEISLPLMAVRRQLASAVELIVQVGRFKDGTRKVQAVTEVCGLEGDTVSSQDIFLFEQEGEDGAGKILGALKPTGVAAEFYKKAKAEGQAMDFGVFISKNPS
jgi:pilus assembly protein CpaF